MTRPEQEDRDALANRNIFDQACALPQPTQWRIDSALQEREALHVGSLAQAKLL